MAESNGDRSSYVRTDEHGVMRIGDTQVPLESVVIGFQEGESAETIQRNYRSLNLEQVYGAIAYYLRHHQEVDEYLRRQEKVWADLKAKIDENPPPVVIRLRALQRARSGAAE